MRIRAKVRKGLVVVTCWLQSFLMAASLPEKHSESVGLLWVRTGNESSLLSRAKTEREITDEIENKLGRRVVKPREVAPIPLEAFRLAKVRKELIGVAKKLSRQALSDKALSMSADSEAKLLIDEINRLSSQLPKGTFGPEIQLSRLVQAGWYWRNRNLKKFKHLCGEAAETHPFRRIDFEVLSDEPLKEVFEEQCRQVSPGVLQKKCKLDVIDENVEQDSSIWINGFQMNTRGIEVFPGNYLVIRRDKKGTLYERVIKCDNAFGSDRGGSWGLIKNKVRIEHLIPSELEKVSDLLILAKDSTGLGKYHYNPQTGLENWQLRKENVSLARESSFSAGREQKWYNTKTIWWIVGTAIATGAVLSLRREAEPQAPFKLKLKSGP